MALTREDEETIRRSARYDGDPTKKRRRKRRSGFYPDPQTGTWREGAPPGGEGTDGSRIRTDPNAPLNISEPTYGLGGEGGSGQSMSKIVGDDLASSISSGQYGLSDDVQKSINARQLEDLTGNWDDIMKSITLDAIGRRGYHGDMLTAGGYNKAQDILDAGRKLTTDLGNQYALQALEDKNATRSSALAASSADRQYGLDTAGLQESARAGRWQEGQTTKEFQHQKDMDIADRVGYIDSSGGGGYGAGADGQPNDGAAAKPAVGADGRVSTLAGRAMSNTETNDALDRAIKAGQETGVFKDPVTGETKDTLEKKLMDFEYGTGKPGSDGGLKGRAMTLAETNAALERAIAQGEATGTFVDPVTGASKETLESKLQTQTIKKSDADIALGKAAATGVYKDPVTGQTFDTLDKQKLELEKTNAALERALAKGKETGEFTDPVTGQKYETLEKKQYDLDKMVKDAEYGEGGFEDRRIKTDEDTVKAKYGDDGTGGTEGRKLDIEEDHYAALRDQQGWDNWADVFTGIMTAVGAMGLSSDIKDLIEGILKFPGGNTPPGPTPPGPTPGPPDVDPDVDPENPNSFSSKFKRYPVGKELLGQWGFRLGWEALKGDLEWEDLPNNYNPVFFSTVGAAAGTAVAGPIGGWIGRYLGNRVGEAMNDLSIVPGKKRYEGLIKKANDAPETLTLEEIEWARDSIEEAATTAMPGYDLRNPSGATDGSVTNNMKMAYDFWDNAYYAKKTTQDLDTFQDYYSKASNNGEALTALDPIISFIGQDDPKTYHAVVNYVADNKDKTPAQIAFGLVQDGVIDPANIEGVFKESFGQKQGDEKFNPALDVNGDGKIDFADFASYATTYSQKITTSDPGSGSTGGPGKPGDPDFEWPANDPSNPNNPTGLDTGDELYNPDDMRNGEFFREGGSTGKPAGASGPSEGDTQRINTQAAGFENKYAGSVAGALFDTYYSELGPQVQIFLENPANQDYLMKIVNSQGPQNGDRYIRQWLNDQGLTGASKQSGEPTDRITSDPMSPPPGNKSIDVSLSVLRQDPEAMAFFNKTGASISEQEDLFLSDPIQWLRVVRGYAK